MTTPITGDRLPSSDAQYQVLSSDQKDETKANATPIKPVYQTIARDTPVVVGCAEPAPPESFGDETEPAQVPSRTPSSASHYNEQQKNCSTCTARCLFLFLSIIGGFSGWHLTNFLMDKYYNPTNGK
jgi:hypothetical protein